MEPDLANFSVVSCQHGWEYDRTFYQDSIISEWDLVCDKQHYPTIALVRFTDDRCKLTSEDDALVFSMLDDARLSQPVPWTTFPRQSLMFWELSLPET